MKSLLNCTLGLCFALPTIAVAQGETEREQLEVKLLRDQRSILRKAERLQDLMKNLRDRYKSEERQREVALLEKGLAHLKAIGLMDTVAGVSADLDARALSQANQKAKKVVDDLQALLQILLDRPSMEKIDEEINKTKKMEDAAAELEQRQTNLLDENRKTSKSAASEAERKLTAEFRQLARMQRAEAEETLRNAGTRQPFLENALRKIEKLQRNQKDLENTLRTQRENPDAKDPARDQLFDIGALKQQTLEQMASRSRQRNMERVAERARRLQEATARQDATETQEANDALRGELERARKNQTGDLPEQIDKLMKKLEAAKPEELGDAAKEIEEEADAEVKAQKILNNADLDRLAGEAKKTADKFESDRKADKKKPGQPEANVKGAAKDLADAAKEGRQEDRTQQTLSKLSQALRKLDEARTGVQRRNPSNENHAGKMATDAAETARELRESPGARPEEENRPNNPNDRDKPNDANQPAENRAANRLDDVEREMRKIAEELKAETKARKAGDQPDRNQQKATDQKLAETRRKIEEARQALENELRSNDQNQRTREQSAKRQQQLNGQAQNLRDRMKQAEQSGELSKQQQQSADRAVQRAQQEMKKAEQSLRNSRESQAAREQQAASEQLDKAREELERNRPLNDEQKQQLKDQAREQKKLADDIMQLAKLAEQRRNQRAQQALDRAAQKAEEAAEELEKGENDEAEKKQEEARDALREARDELREERERYEDLRQEELLFKIREELKQFLAKQEPITKNTEAAGQALAKTGRLSRRSRRRLNELGDEEQELQTKAGFMRRALEEEDVLVFSYAIKASEQDLAEVKKRLAGSRPQPDGVTVVLQKDVEDRTRKLIAALKREQKRRQEERKNREQDNREQQPREPNQRPNRRPRLVSIVAELEMLKQMEQDMLRRTEFMGKLIEARGDAVSEIDLALLERLAHRHNQITEIFLALKKQVEASLNPEQGEEDPAKKDGDDPKKKGGGPGK